MYSTFQRSEKYVFEQIHWDQNKINKIAKSRFLEKLIKITGEKNKKNKKKKTKQTTKKKKKKKEEL